MNRPAARPGRPRHGWRLECRVAATWRRRAKAAKRRCSEPAADWLHCATAGSSARSACRRPHGTRSVPTTMPDDRAVRLKRHDAEPRSGLISFKATGRSSWRSSSGSSAPRCAARSSRTMSFRRRVPKRCGLCRRPTWATAIRFRGSARLPSGGSSTCTAASSTPKNATPAAKCRSARAAAARRSRPA